MIKYRPHKGSLEESIKSKKEFNDIEGMYFIKLILGAKTHDFSRGIQRRFPIQK